MLAAAAENQGEPTTGRAIFDAYLAGLEVTARIGEGAGSTWALGAAAAVSRLKRLTAEQAAQAMSIAVSQVAGYTGRPTANDNALQAGLVAKAAVVATTLAANGLTGAATIHQPSKQAVKVHENGSSNHNTATVTIENLGITLVANRLNRVDITREQLLTRISNHTGFTDDSPQIVTLQNWIEATDISEIISSFAQV